MTTQPNSSVRRILRAAVTLLVVMPAVALAQSPGPPVVELGVQGSKRTGFEGAVAWSPRLTVPLKPRTAIEGTTDIQKPFTFGGGYRKSARTFSVHWRQTVFTSGRLQIFGVLGGGRNRVETDVPERAYQLPDGRRFVEPAHTSVASEFVAHFGPAVQVELAPWLALRGDLQGIIGQRDQGVRGMVGAVIPIRRFRADDQPAQSAPPPAAWRRVKPGREVWVTTNSGSLVHGEIAAISDSSLNIREQDREVTIGLDDVRLVEGRDSVKNGLVIGGASGGLAGGVLFALFSAAACESDPCGSAGAAFMLGAASGAAVGGLLGMMVDGLIPGRQTLFGGSTTVVTPVITATGKAVNVAIRWR